MSLFCFPGSTSTQLLKIKISIGAKVTDWSSRTWTADYAALECFTKSRQSKVVIQVINLSLPLLLQLVLEMRKILHSFLPNFHFYQQNHLFCFDIITITKICGGLVKFVLVAKNDNSIAYRITLENYTWLSCVRYDQYLIKI